MRILCLHGYTQSADVFRAKIGGLRKALKKKYPVAEFLFLDGPHEAKPLAVTADTGENAEITGGRAWFVPAAGVSDSPAVAFRVEGYPEARAQVLRFLKRQFAAGEPVQGMMGFSQGGCTAALVLAELMAIRAGGDLLDHGLDETRRQERAELLAEFSDVPLPQFALFFASSLPRDEQLLEELKGNVAAARAAGAPTHVPTLHIYGTCDKLVSTERAGELAASFESSRTVVHEKGHCVPVARAPLTEVLAWLEQYA